MTAHPSAVSVPIIVLLYNGPLLCGFNVPIKVLIVLKTNKQNHIPPKTETLPAIAGAN